MWHYGYATECRDTQNSIEQVEGSTKLFEVGNSKFTIHNSKLADAVDTAIENRQSESIFPCAVIFGNEVKGVKQSVVDMSDGCLEIPQFGTKHSLNVSVTAGIVVWEFAKMKLAKQPQHQQ